MRTILSKKHNIKSKAKNGKQSPRAQKPANDLGGVSSSAAGKKTHQVEGRLIKTWYPSMEAMEGATGIPYTILQQAKKSGCVAFHRAGRVNAGDFIHWFFTTGIDAAANIDYGELNQELDAKLKQVKLDIQLRGVIAKEEVQECMQQIMGTCLGAVKRMAIEFPKTLEMRSAVEIKELSAALYKDILGRVEKELEKLITKEG